VANDSLGDIRTVTPEEHWAHFEKAWKALKSYTYLGKTTPVMDKGVERETMPLRHDMRNNTGGITAGPLCILAPEPDWLDDECVPAPVTMTYAILDPAYDVTRLETLREVISVGRSMGYSRARIVDADNHQRVIAISSGSGVSLGGVPPGFYPIDNPVNDVADSPDLPSLLDVFGISERPDGALEIEKVTPMIASPHSALHQGPINFALEGAATNELKRSLGTVDLQIESYSVMFVTPGYQGPFVATAELVNPTGSRFGVEMTMRDEGHDNRIMATASASFYRVSRL
jgi:acyl-coenzyme A thioesterase PaaI-like protein